MEWNIALIVIGALIIPLVLSGLPVATVLLLTSIILLWVMVGPIKAMYMVSQEIGHFWSSWTVLAIPLFVLMGELLFVGGSATEIFDMVSKWLRRIRGGQALVSTGACAVFASMCGSSAGGTSAMAIVTIPEMLKRGYSPRLSTGCISAAGALAHLIPPSILMVVYASIVEISPGKALLAAVIPGILLAVYYGIVVFTWATVHPSAAPQEPSSTWKEKFVSLKVAWQPITLIMAVLGSLYFGIATATEAAAMGAFFALLMTLLKTRGDFQKIGQAFLGAARISCFIMLIAVSGKILAMTMTYYMIPQNAVRVMLSFELSPLMVMIAIQFLYILIGAFVEPIGIMVVTLPIIAPVLLALGFDPYWFGVMLMVNFEMALVTPPMGTQLYIIKGVVPEVPLKDILVGALVFLIADTAMLVTLYVFPQLALWLPGRIG
jgi:tripartite ATP-independent transporter DctM subunit